MDSVTALGERTMSKVKWRLLPFCFLLYVINFMDRQNIGFAAMDMNKELGITPVYYGMLATAFFISYFVFEVPSNILLHRFGANKWIARIMVTWGLVTMVMMLVQEFWHLYALRFLLGMMEAGFFPGMIYYFTYWFPAQHRARAVATFMLALPFANIVGSPLAAWMIDNIHWLGLSGWRWVFFLEGLPAVLLGIVCWFYLTNRPEEAKWLTEEEKNWLVAELKKEEKKKEESKHMSLRQVLANGKVLWLCFIFFAFTAATNCFGIWLPIILKEFSKASNTAVGVLLMIPYSFSAVSMYLWSWKSDKSGDRRWHAALPNIVAAIGLIIAGTGTTLAVKMAGLVTMVMGANAVNSPFWTLPAAFLTGSAAAAGIAFINSFASVGGIVGNTIVGYIKQYYPGSPNAPLFFLAGCFIVAALAILALPKQDTTTATSNSSVKGSA